MRVLTMALAGSVMALALAAAGASAQETRIIVITHGQASDTFWSVVKNGVDDAAELMGGSRCSIRRPRPSTWSRWRS